LPIRTDKGQQPQLKSTASSCSFLSEKRVAHVTGLLSTPQSILAKLEETKIVEITGKRNF